MNALNLQAMFNMMDDLEIGIKGLEDRSGISRFRINKIMHLSDCKLSELRLLCDALDCDVLDLLDWDE